ncbi:hypothetical protein [Nocardia alni]|uniref:hypothetical protein n=1 Tax=Nocardia alni TaxID=2815723 RepID=UPI001C226B41|nr:hypothetical protein [Nocardia alni]
MFPELDTATALAQKWTTPLFNDRIGVDHRDLEPLENLQAVALIHGLEPTLGFGLANVFMVLDEVIR